MKRMRLNRMPRKETRIRYVYIDNWNNRRRIAIERDRVFLEITAGDCGCETCRERVSSSRRVLSSYRGRYAWITRQGSQWVVFPRKAGERVLPNLRKRLDFFRLTY
jgi:hypothetical protein